MKDRAWLVYPAVAVAATAIYFAFGHDSFLFNLIGLSSPVLILVAVRLHKPDRRAPWFLIAAGQFLFIAGDVVSYNYVRFSEALPQVFPLDFTHNPMGDVPFPGPADVLYLSVYPCLIAGVMLLIQARNPGSDRASLLDSMMVAIGVGTVTWVLLIAPYLDIADLDLKIKLTAMAYPMMDLLLAGAAIRLAVGAGRRPVAFYLLVASIVALFATDAIYAWFGLYTESGYQPGSGWLEAGWMSFYVLLCTAALHPSMRTLTERAPQPEERLTLSRLVLLTVAALSPPVLRLVQSARGEDVDVGILSAASIVLFLLVVVRMAGLIRQQEHSAERERALRRAGAALVTATSRDGIHEAAIDAARALAGEDAAIRMCDESHDDDGFIVVAAAGGEDVHGERFGFSTLQEWKRQRLLENDAYIVKSYESTLRDPLRLPRGGDGSVFVAPLFIRDELHGLMVVATPEDMPRSVGDSLRALSSQVALALESAALTEDLVIKQSEARFASLVSNSSDVVCVLDPDTTVTYASPSTARVLGFDPTHVEGTRFADLIHPDDLTRVLQFLSPVGEAEGHTGLVEFRIRRRNGDYVHTETLRTPLLHDPNVRGIVLNTRDVTERKQFEEQLSHQAFHDSVTTLANRALFHDRVTHALERQVREHEPISVLFMDLDDFKTINDSLGHAAGDQLLYEVGERLKGCLRAADTAARLGGDEFAILLEDGEEGVHGGRRGRAHHADARGAVHAGGQGGLRASLGGHRDRRRRAGRRRRRAPAQRRRRHVHGEGTGQGPVPGVRARHARHRSQAARAQGRPAARDRARGVPAALPARDRARDRAHHGRGGARALDPPGSRTRAAARFHPARRGDGPDRADRTVGDARGVPLRRGAAGAVPERSAPAHGRQPVGPPDLSPRARRRGSGDPRRDRPRPRLADPRDHRERDDAGHGAVDRAAGRVEGARRAARGRRLRHRATRR